MAHKRRRSALSFMVAVLFCVGLPLSAQPAANSPHDGGLPADIAALQQRAQNGDGHAAYLLGRAYMEGKGVHQDLRKAGAWFTLAANRGSADGDFALGYLYEHGEGFARNFHRAVIYYIAAAESGHPEAENNLASMYEHGKGVKKNLQQAMRWYLAAANQGEMIAQCNL